MICNQKNVWTGILISHKHYCALVMIRPVTCLQGCVTCLADGDEKGGEGPGEEQQGPQKPKKVLTLTMCNLYHS